MNTTHKSKSATQLWPVKALAVAVAIGLTGSIAYAADRKPIGDLEIYAQATPGTATIFMMLDISGSMGVVRGYDSIQRDYNVSCGSKYATLPKQTITAVVKQPDGNNQTITYQPKGCTIKDTLYLDRISRLQRALIELLADEVYIGTSLTEDNRIKDKGSIPNSYEIGLGNYSTPASAQVPNPYRSGNVVVPTRRLDSAQRLELITAIKGLVAIGGTPTAQAFAESGAYMMGTSTYGSGGTPGSGFLSSVASSKEGDRYKSPANDNECSGNGIYLLTDGQPNQSSEQMATTVMNNSLQGSGLALGGCNDANNGGLVGDQDQAWGCMGSYASILRNPANPIELPIKTATVGFGSEFKGLTGTRTILANGKALDIIDCESGAKNPNRLTFEENNVRNLCKVGERQDDNGPQTLGAGGFYYTEESAEIAASIVDFSSTLVQTINTVPSGTITIPNDPYLASNQLATAYLPMLEPNISEANSIWAGNLKKYNLDAGSLFGGANRLLYTNVAGDLDKLTRDIWQGNTDFLKLNPVSNINEIANNEIKAGGVYAKLRAPNSGLSSVRSVYVEDYTDASSSKPTLRKIGVDANGRTTGFGDLVDTVTYTQLNKLRLLSFLGFDNLLTNDGQPISATKVEDLQLSAPTKEIKILGGVVHSKPTAVSYGAELSDNGSVTNTRDDYVLFGSMDGALHLVDDKDGMEEFAIIPKYMLEAQPKALVEGSKKSNVGEPYFGVDAPWLVMTDYKFDLANKKVTVDTASDKGVHAYGGLRMGGEAFYGMDITDKSEPKIIFTITPDGRNYTTSNDFKRLGQIWSTPVAAKIRETEAAEPIDVLVFGGGYDMRYENDDYVPTTAAPARGNAIYIINAKTGALIKSISGENGGSNNTKATDMINSIVGEVAVLDRDNDGLMDHIYAADLGGQVFRVDYQNARPAKFGFSAVANASVKRVERVLNSAPTNAADKKFAYRFYERPVVSFYRNNGGANNGSIFALVNVISGNRSAPLSTLRNDNNYANRVYGIIDNDVTKANLFESSFIATNSNVTEAKLVNLAVKLTATPTPAQKNDAKLEMIAGTKQGWYYPLTRFDGYNNVRYNKGIGDSVVINNLLYTTVYNPDKQYKEVASCTAKISGGSERQLYCLPYGVCMDDTSVSGTGGYVPAGQGIQELTLGAYNDKNRDIKVLIGTTTITDRIAVANRTGYGTDANKDPSNLLNTNYLGGANPSQATGDGSAAEYLFNERYTLQPRAWYKRDQ